MAAQQQDKWHEGEKTMHRRLNLTENAARISEFVRPAMPEQHRAFFAGLPLFLLGSVSSSDGSCWASVVWGRSGFIAAPSAHELQFGDVGAASGDPLRENLAVGAHIGGLGIEFLTRRRNRVNGVVTAVHSSSNSGKLAFDMRVSQSFGNCPKYIQARTCEDMLSTTTAPPPPPPGPVETATKLSPVHTQLILRADTMFVASTVANDENMWAVGTDVSHRGGAPGFVVVQSDVSLQWPDYIGNFMFNTIGNLLRNPSCGLVFLNFDNGDLLQLSGRAEVLHDVKAQPGAQRSVRFSVEQVRYSPRAMPFRWTFVNASPFNPSPVADDAAANDPATRAAQQVVIQRIIQETPAIKTYWMTFVDERARHKQPAVAGQYGTFELEVPKLDNQPGYETIVRTWTISSAFLRSSDQPAFSISVKRMDGGRASCWLFDRARVGDQLVFKGFSGEFVLKQEIVERRPVLLLAAGVGITPIASILRSLVIHNELQLLPRVDLLYGARTERDMPFQDEFAALACAQPNFWFWKYFSQPAAAAADKALSERIQCQLHAHVDLQAIAALFNAITDVPDYRSRVQIFLCGPKTFMSILEEGLQKDLGLRASQITSESFNY